MADASEPALVRELADLPFEMWESILQLSSSLREKVQCSRLCKTLRPAARAVVDDSVRSLKDELLATVRPAMLVGNTPRPPPGPLPSFRRLTPRTSHHQPTAPTDVDEGGLPPPGAALAAGRAILSTALSFGGLGHLCGYPAVSFKHCEGFEGRKDFRCTPSTRVLHCAGLRVRVRPSERMRAVLGDAVVGAWHEFELAPPPAGFWTCDDVIAARRRIQHVLLVEHTERIEAATREEGRWDEESPPADSVEAVLRVQSFGLDEVVLSVDAVAYNQEYFWDNI